MGLRQLKNKTCKKLGKTLYQVVNVENLSGAYHTFQNNNHMRQKRNIVGNMFTWYMALRFHRNGGEPKFLTGYLLQKFLLDQKILCRVQIPNCKVTELSAYFYRSHLFGAKCV